MTWPDIIARLASGVGTQFALLSRFQLALVVLCVLALVYTYAHLVIISGREARQRRLAALKPKIRPRAQSEGRLDLAWLEPRNWYARFGAVIAASPVVGKKDRARLARLLADAGFRGKHLLATLIATKICGCAIMILAAWFAATIYGWFADSSILRFAIVLGIALLGWRIPDLVLAQIARRRRRAIEGAFPDALDLLVISSEAGLSLDHGIEFVAKEMGAFAPALSEEFAITSAELRVLGDRRQALQRFAERINLASVRSVVATLIQTMRYGTPLAQSLRLLAAEMRTARLLRLEERAARMPVLLTLPLMGLILPSLLIVVAGPATLKIIDAFGAIAK